MINNFPERVLTKEVRLSYAYLTQPKASRPNEAPKYSTALLIPKTDVETIAAINNAIKYAYEKGVMGKWAGKHPPMKEILHDGDGVRQNGAEYGAECKGCWVLNASKKASNGAPFLCTVDDKTGVSLNPSEIYSGIYARVTLEFYPFDRPDSKGVACGLRGVMKTRDGEPLTGSVVTASEFENVDVTPTAQPGAPAFQPQYNPVVGQQAAPVPQTGYAQPGAPVAPTGNRPAVNPITGQPW